MSFPSPVYLLPCLPMYGVLAIGEFCDLAQAELKRLAKTVDRRAGVSTDWRLHPPELAEAYKEWCRHQLHPRVVPWILLGLHLQITLRLHSTPGLSCETFPTFGAFMCFLHLLMALLHTRLEPLAHATMQGAFLLLRGSLLGALFLQRDQCILSLATSFMQSRIGLMAGTAMSLQIYCGLYPVAMEYTFPVLSFSLVLHFFLVCLRFHAIQFPTLTLANIDFWAAMACLMATILGGQVALIIRYSVGVINMRYFLKARRASQQARQHPD